MLKLVAAYLTLALESFKARPNGKWAAAIAEKWLKDASFEAMESDEEQWDRWREEFRAR